MSDFPPKTAHPDQVAFALNVLATATGGRTALYVSTPITTGDRYIRWLRNGGALLPKTGSTYRQQHVAQVIEPNLQAVRPVVAALRASTPRAVIDPTVLPDIQGWHQDDYRAFWALVIERLADTVIFLDGWQYSEGSCYEWYTAYRTGARCLDHNHRPLTRDAALAQIAIAIKELREVHGSTAFLESVYDAITHMPEPVADR
jgi:hypothetical protein